MEASKEFTVANMSFAFDMYKVLRSQQGGIFFSPFSISTALSMVFCGAKTDTATELTKALHYEGIKNVVGCHGNLSKLLNSLGNKVTLSSANKLYVQDQYKILKTFIDVMTKYFSSQPQLCDFKKCEDVRQVINNWASQKTNDKIKDLIPSGSLTSNTKAVIVNAVYFKGQWALKFDPNKTKKDKFFISSTESVTVDMMNRKEKYLYGVDPRLGCQFVKLPYDAGISMVVILPTEDHNLPAVEEKLDSSSFKLLLQSGKAYGNVNVSLPRYTLKKQMDLVSTLRRLGVENLFEEGSSDLSGINGERTLFVSSVVHQSFIDVDEEGSEAAAATSGWCFDCKTPQFKVNQPFMMFILHDKSNTVLFMGKVENPTLAS